MRPGCMREVLAVSNGLTCGRFCIFFSGSEGKWGRRGWGGIIWSRGGDIVVAAADVFAAAPHVAVGDAAAHAFADALADAATAATVFAGAGAGDTFADAAAEFWDSRKPESSPPLHRTRVFVVVLRRRISRTNSVESAYFPLVLLEFLEHNHNLR